jgi:hypothetical protein
MIATYPWEHTIELGDVVQNGVTVPLWQGQDQTGSFKMYNSSTTSQTFWMWLGRGTQPWTIVGGLFGLTKCHFPCVFVLTE